MRDCSHLCPCLSSQVLCLAAFFALVIKKVDEEDFQNVALVNTKSSQGKEIECIDLKLQFHAQVFNNYIPLPTGDLKDQQALRMDRNLYEPPHPADVERMKRNKIMEQKAFSLLKEILSEYSYSELLQTRFTG